jgi:von Hippel-Lindau disease tumor suppressor protein
MQRFLVAVAMMLMPALVALLPVGAAHAAPCSRHVKSLNSNTPVTVTFLNKSGEFRGVKWVDFKGKWVSYAKLNPGQSYTVNTYATHPWVFTDGNGHCVEMWVTRAGVSKFKITAK